MTTGSPFAQTAFGQHLIAALDRHHSDDPLEQSFLPRMRALAAMAGDPRSRHHFDPGHWTASAFVVDAQWHHVLLILHGKLNRWLQPGGHIEAGDADVVAAARREVTEETGLTGLELVAAPFDLDIHTIPPHKHEPAHLHYDVRVLFRAVEHEATAGDGVQACQWVALDAVGTLESDESVRRAVRRIQRMACQRGA